MRPKAKCGELEESPCTNELRRELHGLRGRPVILVGPSALLIVAGVVGRVTCGTVELTDTSLIGSPTLIASLCTLTAVIPLTAMAAAEPMIAALRTGGV